MATKFKNGIESNGEVRLPYRIINANRTLDASDYTIECNGDYILTSASANSTTFTFTTTVANPLVVGSIVAISNYSNATFGNGTYTVLTKPTNSEFTVRATTNAYLYSYTNITGAVHCPITVTLPTAVGNIGRIYNIKNTGLSAFVTLAGASFTTTATATSGAGQTVLSVASATGITVGSSVTGTGITYPSIVTAVNGSSITIDQPTTSSWISGGSVTFQQEIDGYPTHIIEANYHTATVQSNGSKWMLI